MVLPNSYDREAFTASLRGMERSQRIVFCASCVELLVPLLRKYEQNWPEANIEPILRTLGAIWTHVEGGGVDQPDWAALDAELTELTPDDEDDTIPFRWHSVAFYATLSAAYSVEVCAENSAESAMWAAEQIFNLTDDLVIKGERIDPKESDSGGTISRHRAMQNAHGSLVGALSTASSGTAADEARRTVSGSLSDDLYELILKIPE